MSDNIKISSDKNIIRSFNIIIGISFILLTSALYITYILNINIPALNSDLSELENIISKRIVFYIRIYLSFFIPLTFFIFTFLFTLNPINVKSLLISFIFIFLTAFYLYRLPYNLLINPFENTNILLKLIVHIISAYIIIIFNTGMSYMKYDLRNTNHLYNFYTMIADMVIWSFLIFFIIFIIFAFISYVFYFRSEFHIKRIANFLIKNNFRNLKIILCLFAVLKVSVIYFSYVLYSKMINTRLSVIVSRTVSLLFCLISVFIMILSFKYSIFNNHYNIKFLLYFLFMTLFIFNMFLFRIDIKHIYIEYYIYIFSNIIGAVFSIFLIYIGFNRIAYFFILNIIIAVNFIYNVCVSLFKSNIKFIFAYNYIYIIFFAVLLFY